jgi:hypothetical protein
MLGSEEYYKLHGNRPLAWVAALMPMCWIARRTGAKSSWIEALGRLGSSREKTATEFLGSAKLELDQRRP